MPEVPLILFGGTHGGSGVVEGSRERSRFSRYFLSESEIFIGPQSSVSNTLGTPSGLAGGHARSGYERGALVFAGALALVAAAYFLTKLRAPLLFWAAFILDPAAGRGLLGDISHQLTPMADSI